MNAPFRAPELVVLIAWNLEPLLLEPEGWKLPTSNPVTIIGKEHGQDQEQVEMKGGLPSFGWDLLRIFFAKKQAKRAR